MSQFNLKRLFAKTNLYNSNHPQKLHIQLLTIITMLMFVAVLSVNAQTQVINFENFTPGLINGQQGWGNGLPGGANCQTYDHNIITNASAPTSFGAQSFQISNYITSGCFDQTFSSPTTEAGETSAVNGGNSVGPRQKHFEVRFDLAAAVPGAAPEPDSYISVSPDRGDGGRMSYLRFEDQNDGIHVIFDEYIDAVPTGGANADPAGCAVEDDFTDELIATLPRSTAHNLRFVMDFVDGPRNDVVQIYIDGVLTKTGTSWEDYFRYCPEQAGSGNQVPTVDSVLFRTGGGDGITHPTNQGKGFLIDNVFLPRNFSTAVAPYNVFTEFSINSNPNAEYTYGNTANADKDSAFTSYPQPRAAAFSTPGIDGWYRGVADILYGVPGVYTNTNPTATSYTDAPSVVHPANMLMLHPGEMGERSVVRFTAPTAGNYQINGQFQGIDTGGTSTDVLVLYRSAADLTTSTALFSGVVNGYGVTNPAAIVPFAVPFVTLAAGDVIEFSVGYGNGTFGGDSTGLQAVIALETGRPAVTVSPSMGTFQNAPITFTFNFTDPNTMNPESVTDFDINDITVAGGTKSAFMGSGSTYTVTVTPSGSGTVTVSVPENAAADSTGNLSTASNTASVTVDGSAPTVTINKGAAQADPTSTTSIIFDVVFSEPVTTFMTGDVTVTGSAFGSATPSAIVAGSGANYTVTVSGMTRSGTVIASIAAGVAPDEVSNPNAASTSTDNIVFYNFVAGNNDNLVSVNPTNTAAAFVPGTYYPQWVFADESPGGGTGSGSFVTGPMAPPLPIGSVRLQVNGTGRYNIATQQFAGTRFADISDLRYSTYQNNASNPNAQSAAIALQFDIDSDVTDGNTDYQGRLVYEPYLNSGGTVPQGGWNEWNTLNGVFYGSTTGTPGAPPRPVSVFCTPAAPCTRADLLAQFPNVGIRLLGVANPANGALLLRAGGPVTGGFDGNADKLVVGINGNTTTFNYEPTPPTLSISDGTATEGDVGSTTMTFTVTQSEISNLPTTVQVSTTSGSATGNSDYVTISNQPVTIPVGMTTATFNVTVNGDVVFEGDETFTVTLSNPVNAVVNVPNPADPTMDGTGTGTITDNETRPTVTLTAVSPNVTEGGTATFQANLSGASSTATTVTVTAANGAVTPATSPADYSLITTSVTFPANSTTAQPISVTTVDDAIYEGPTAETFTVSLGTVMTGTADIGTPSSQPGTIADNDVCTYMLTPTGMTFGVAGGSSQTFTVNVNQGCTINATSNAGFITVNGVSGNTVTYSVASNAPSPTNSGGPRSGTITVGGTGSSTAIFTVTQADAQAVIVTAPTITGQLRGADVNVPISVTDTNGRDINSYDFRITYDPAVLQFNPAISQSGTVSANSGFNVGITDSTPVGTLRISGFAGSGPLSGAGTLFNLRFTVIGTANPQTSNLTFTAARLNEGVPAVNTVNGSISIVNGAVTGAVTYGVVPITSASPTPTPKRVTGVLISADGTSPSSNDFSTTTACDGTYSLSMFSSDTYTVTPTKANNFNNMAVSSLDAFAVQNFVLGRPNSALSTSQQVVADVSGNGEITSFDAALIQRYVTNSGNPPPSTPPQTNKTGMWMFDPTNRMYTALQLQSNQANQDYSAILFGDVTGSYKPTDDDGGCSATRTNSESETSQRNVAIAAGAPVIVNLPTQSAGNGVAFDIPISVDDVTNLNINSYDLVFSYDPAVLQPLATATDKTGTLSVNFSVSSASAGVGRLRVSGFSADGNPLTGSGIMLKLRFTAVGSTGSSSTLSFTSFRFNEGTPTNTIGNGQFTVFSPTAADASISGRVRSAAGKPAGGVTVTLTDSNGVARSVKTSPKGLYRFDEVPTGGIYIIAVSDKFGSGAPQVITLVADLSAFDLIF